MEMLRKTLVGDAESHQDLLETENAASESHTPSPKPSRSFLLHSVSTYLLKAYRETPNPEDKISAEEIHFNVNRSESIKENVSFITTSRLVKSTFKNAHYDKDTKFFHGLERVYPDEKDALKERSVKYSQPRWCSMLMSSLCQLYDNHILCDALIMCRNKPNTHTHLPAHACMLGSASPVLLSKMMENRVIFGVGAKVTIQCDGISYTEWSMVLQFIYKGNVDLCLKDAMRMWIVARFLRIQSLVVLLENLMKDNDITLSSKWRNQCIDQGDIAVVPFRDNVSDDFTESLMSNSISQSSNFEESPPSIISQNRHDIMSQFDIKSIAENVINSFRRESPVPSQTDMQQETQVSPNDENEPKSKRRKMYKPRKVAPKCDLEREPQSDVSVIGTIQTRMTNNMNFAQDNEVAHLDYETHLSNEKAIDTDTNAAENTLIDTDVIARSIKEEPVDLSDSGKAPGVYMDTAEDGDAYQYNPRPVVIAPLESAVSPRSMPSFPVKKENNVMYPDTDERGDGGSSGDGSMLYDLLNTKSSQPETPMLKSLLASRVVATQSPNPGLNHQNKAGQADSESDLKEMLFDMQELTDTDPDYTPLSAKKKKKKRTTIPKSAPGATAVDESAPEPASPPQCSQGGSQAPMVLTWSDEDLQKERLKLGGHTDFSASSLLLSMINKATPKGNSPTPVVPAAKPAKPPVLEEPLVPESHAGSSATPASNILVSLLGKKNESEKNIKAFDDRNRMNRQADTDSSQGGLLFSQVLQGMASAYSSPIASNRSPQAGSPAFPSLSISKSHTNLSHDAMTKETREDGVSHSDNEVESNGKSKSKRKSAKTKNKRKSNSGIKIRMTFSKSDKSGDSAAIKTECDDKEHDTYRNDSPDQSQSMEESHDMNNEPITERDTSQRSCLETLLSSSSKSTRSFSPVQNSASELDTDNVTTTLSHLKSLLIPAKGSMSIDNDNSSCTDDVNDANSKAPLPMLEPITDIQAHFPQDPKDKQWNEYVQSIMKNTSLS